MRITRSYNLYIAVAALVIGLIVWINVRIYKSAVSRNPQPVNGDSQDEGWASRESVPAAAERQKTATRHAGKLGETVQEVACDPAYWDLQMERMLGSPQTTAKIKRQGTFRDVQQPTSEFRKKMQWIDVRIREYENIVRYHPRDIDAQRQLQDLYMLRSSLKSVEDIVTTKDKK